MDLKSHTVLYSRKDGPGMLGQHTELAQCQPSYCSFESMNFKWQQSQRQHDMEMELWISKVTLCPIKRKMEVAMSLRLCLYLVLP